MRYTLSFLVHVKLSYRIVSCRINVKTCMSIFFLQIRAYYALGPITCRTRIPVQHTQQSFLRWQPSVVRCVSVCVIPGSYACCSCCCCSAVNGDKTKEMLQSYCFWLTRRLDYCDALLSATYSITSQWSGGVWFQQHSLYRSVPGKQLLRLTDRSTRWRSFLQTNVYAFILSRLYRPVAA